MSVRTRLSDPDGQTEVVGVDEKALAEAERMLGTASPRDTVNQALREVIRKKLVSEYVEMLRTRELLPEPVDEIRTEAWR
jgi:hypothetical protein